VNVSVRKYFPQNPTLSEEAMVDGFRQETAIFASLRTVAFALPLTRDRVLYLTPSAADLYGEQVDLLIEHPNFWLEAIHPEDKPAVWLGMEKLRDSDHGGVEFTYRLMASDGEITWVSHRCRLTTNDAGVPLRIDCLVTPTAAPVKTRLRDEPGSAVFAAAADALLLRDALTLDIIEANAAALQLFRCGRAELLRQDLADLSARTEGFNARAEAPYLDAARHGRPQRYDWLVAPREGDPRWVEIVTSVFAHGERECLLSIIRDVDVQRRERDRQLLATEMIDHTRDAIGFADPAGQLQALNPAGIAILGVTAEGVQDLFLTDLLPAWGQPHFLHTCLPLATKDGIWRGEMALVNREGRNLPVVLTVLAHKRSGALRGYSFIAQDVTAYKLAVQRMKRDKEGLEADKLVKDKLLENVSASLLRPLEQLRQIATLLERNPADLPRALPHLKHAVEQAHRLVGATTEFLKSGAQRDLPPR